MRNRLQREEQYEKDTMCCCSDYGIALLHRVYRKRSAALSFPGELNNKIRQVFGVWLSLVERLVRDQGRNGSKAVLCARFDHATAVGSAGSSELALPTRVTSDQASSRELEKPTQKLEKAGFRRLFVLSRRECPFAERFYFL